MTDPVHELDFTALDSYGAQAEPEDIRDLLDAIDGASDQNRVTWVVLRGKRIAKIAPVDEIPESAFGRAVAQHDEIIAGFERAYPELAAWRERVRSGRAREFPPNLSLYGIEARLNTIGQRIGSSARYGEPGIIAQLARMETLQVVTARRVEEIHRVLGLERDEERQLADPLGPPFYGKQAEVTTRLASGGLRLATRERLLDILRRHGLADPEALADAMWWELDPGSSGQPEDPPARDRICISCEQPEGEPHLPTCITRTGTLRLPEGS